ncbi:MAG: bile acid:sodium symporter family protein [Synechococcales cyanobacterium]
MQSSIFTTVLLPLALAIVMLGMGLGLVPEDFRRITRDPKAVAIGVICQMLALPLIGLVVTTVVPLQPELAVGLMVLALCPGGPSSNLMTYLAKGDVALSVTLTAVNSLLTVLTIPVATQWALNHFLQQSATITLPIGQTMAQILIIMVLPIIIGMVIRQRFTERALGLEKYISRLAGGLLALIIILLLVREGSKLPGFLLQVGMGVLLLNLLAMGVGLAVSKGLRLPIPQQVCIAIEVGIQNGTLAIAITAGLLNNAEMAIPAAVYSLLMYLTGFAVILYGRKLSRLALSPF